MLLLHAPLGQLGHCCYLMRTRLEHALRASVAESCNSDLMKECYCASATSSSRCQDIGTRDCKNACHMCVPNDKQHECIFPLSRPFLCWTIH
eukprot:2508968-Amphidinium_carterae.1